MASSAKEKFDAAVKVIRGLPANGPFQPSHDLMLKFYSYYKQATEGPCTLPKPGFWDIVNKKKWEAWTKLGNMEREKAMLLYVDELKKVSNHVRETFYPPKIVETMPQTEEVNVFLQKLDTFYEMVEETQEENHNNNVKDSKHQDEDRLSNGNVNSGGGQEEPNLNYSDNLSLLLKQDIKNAQESTGILISEDRQNGHGVLNGDHSKSPRMNGNVMKYDEDDENKEDEEDEEDDVEDTGDEADNDFDVVRVTATHTVFSPPPASSVFREKEEEEEEVEDETRMRNGGSEMSESETENEEFCDTSDELAIQAPLKPSIPLPSSSSHPNHRPIHSPTPSSTCIPNSSSTPILPTSKTVRINPALDSSLRPRYQNNGLKMIPDSLEVNTSGMGAEQQVESMMNSTTSFSLFSSSLDTSGVVEAEVNCRGGQDEEEARGRRRKGGNHSSRGGAAGGGKGTTGAGGSGGNDSHEGGARYPFSNQGGDGSRDPSTGLDEARSDLNEQIVVTLLRLQRDMSGVLNRLHSLEALVKEGRRQQEKKLKENRWWPFPDLSFKSALLIFLWPIALQVILGYLSRRRRKLHK